MTTNQIRMNEINLHHSLELAKLAEQRRANKAKESETFRANREREAQDIGKISGANPFSLIGYYGSKTQKDSKKATPITEALDLLKTVATFK